MKRAAIGMFDGVHTGHRHLLRFMRESALGNERPLVVTFSNHPLSVVNPAAAPRLLTSPEEKRALLEAEGVEVMMLSFDDELRQLTAAEFMRRLQAEHGVGGLLLGFNNSFGSDRGATFDDYCRMGREIGMEVTAATELPGAKVSSSIIRHLIAEGNVAEAAQLLGYRYRLTGKVVSGNKIGRTIGFPTVNLEPIFGDKLIPASGVYAADALLDGGERYRAVVNIGHRPTIDNSPQLRIEAFLDGFSGNLYGRRLTLEFITRLRDEHKFPDIDALRAQIATDLTRAINY